MTQTRKNISGYVVQGTIRLLQSTFFWLFVVLILIDFGISSVHPLKFVNCIKYLPLDQNSVVSKIPEFFSSQGRPDVLVLGSSLPMTAIALCDAEYVGGINKNNVSAIRTYTKALYLDRLLEKRFGKHFNIFNLSCYACMASDAYLLLSRALDAGKAPRVVFWGIAPRDFMDNTVPAVGKTPVYEVLQDWRCLADIWQRHMNLCETRDFLASSTWYYFRVKADYRTFLQAVAADLLNHPLTLFDASAKEQSATADSLRQADKPGSALADTSNKSHLERDLANYKERYNPPNYKRYNEELVYFQKLLALCQKHNIQAVIINMPISSLNKSLIPSDLYKHYLSDSAKITANLGATFINLDKSNLFQLSDFFDSVHTNASGGKKWQDHLIGQLPNLN